MRYNQIKPLSEQTLTEINMSPSGLRKLASKINAKAGMEFEMIVPNVVAGRSNDDEMEPDYDRDERCTSIDDAARFFSESEFSSRREISQLQASMQDDFGDWQIEKMDDAWQDDGQEYLAEYIKENDFDMDAAREAAADDVRETNPDLSENSEEFAKLVTRHTREKLVEVAEESWDNQDRNYDYARELFEEEKRDEYNESDWLDDTGQDYMSDIERRYEITWPYLISGDTGDAQSIDDIADEFSGAIGRPVNHSTQYHGAERTADGYVVEPDGSLEGNEPSDGGLEFVSPPLPVAELLSDLQKVKQWATKRGAYTGAENGTGLHINVSVEDWAGNMEQLDFVKLAILLGDEYILKQFERQANHYCKSAFSLVQKAIKADTSATAKLLTQMKSHLNAGASKLIHSGTTSKFTSINTKSGYIEFRSPGGDWLNDKFELIEPTLLRCVVALDAAVKPEMYRQEYQKKLYKLLSPSTDEYGIMIKDFSDYVAGVGGAPEQVVKSFRRAALSKLQDQRAVTAASRDTPLGQAQQRAPNSARTRYSLANENGSTISVYDARDLEDAREYFIDQFGDDTNSARYKFFQTVQGLRAAVPLFTQAADPGAAYKQYTVQDRSGYSMLITAASPNAAQQQALSMFPDRFREVVSVVLYEPRGQASTPVPGSTIDLQQQRAAAARAADTAHQAASSGQRWNIMMGDQQVFTLTAATQGEANRAASHWLSQRSPEFNQYHAGQEVEVIPAQA